MVDNLQRQEDAGWRKEGLQEEREEEKGSKSLGPEDSFRRSGIDRKDK